MPASFLEDLLYDGCIRLRPDAERLRASTETAEMLEQAFVVYRQEVAGAPIDFHPQVAVAAALLIENIAWCLLGVNDGAATDVAMRGKPRTASEHLSADMLLRFVPQLARRARGQALTAPLTQTLEDIMRRWPLSGVLADVSDPPLTPLDFAGHPGLLLLYAERLALNEKPDWFPTQPPGLDYVELVWDGLGRELVRQPHKTNDDE